MIVAAYGRGAATAVSPGEVDLQNDGSEPDAVHGRRAGAAHHAGAQAPTIIVDAQSGTIVMNAGVTLGPAVVSHGDLTVNIQPMNSVSQPGPFSNGTTVGVQNTVVNAQQDKAHVVAPAARGDLADVARGAQCGRRDAVGSGRDHRGAETGRRDQRHDQGDLMSARTLRRRPSSLPPAQRRQAPLAATVKHLAGMLWDEMLSELNQTGLIPARSAPAAMRSRACSSGTSRRMISANMTAS